VYATLSIEFDRDAELIPVFVKGSILGVWEIKTAVMSVTSSGKTSSSFSHSTNPFFTIFNRCLPGSIPDIVSFVAVATLPSRNTVAPSGKDFALIIPVLDRSIVLVEVLFILYPDVYKYSTVVVLKIIKSVKSVSNSGNLRISMEVILTHRYNACMEYQIESENILGVRVDFGLNMSSAVNYIEKKLLSNGSCNLISTTNPEFIMDAQKDRDFQNIVNKSALSLPDGVGVLMAKNFIDKTKLIERGPATIFKMIAAGVSCGVFPLDSALQRINGISLVFNLCSLSAQKGYSVFFLGGRKRNRTGRITDQSTEEDFSVKASERMGEYYPGLNIAGATSKFSPREADDEITVTYIKECMRKKNLSTIDFLFVAYGHPKQEKWIIRNAHKLPAKVCIGVGGTFDYILESRNSTVAKNNQEKYRWLSKLVKEPWRFTRVVKAFPLFPLKLFVQEFRSSSTIHTES